VDRIAKLQTPQTAAWLASNVGVIIAALYYTLMLRTTDRIRQDRLFMQAYQERDALALDARVLLGPAGIKP